jgi:hypothetical protein
MKKVGAVVCVVAVIAGLAGWFIFRGTSEKEWKVYVIQMEGPKGPGYFQDLNPELKVTDDLAKAKRFDKKDGDIWLTAIQQDYAKKHAAPAVRQAVKLVGIE